MRAKELNVYCHCGKGTICQTSLKNPDGLPVICWITEDEKIYFRGYCSKCGEEIEFSYPIMQLLFDCPKSREVL